MDDCDKRKLASWTTFHPSEVSRARFVARCLELQQCGVRFSVGVVGLKEHAAEIEALRRELPANVYLWINAYKRQPDYYSSVDLERFNAIDALFPTNNQNHPSLGRACRCGESVMSVYGDGSIRRCHFIQQPIGNLYHDDLAEVLHARPCTNQTCGCHIGYVHLDHLKLYQIYDDGVLERIPRDS